MKGNLRDSVPSFGVALRMRSRCKSGHHQVQAQRRTSIAVGTDSCLDRSKSTLTCANALKCIIGLDTFAVHNSRARQKKEGVSCWSSNFSVIFVFPWGENLCRSMRLPRLCLCWLICSCIATGQSPAKVCLFYSGQTKPKKLPAPICAVTCIGCDNPCPRPPRAVPGCSTMPKVCNGI